MGECERGERVDPRRKERPKTPSSSFRTRAMADAKGNGGEGPTQWDSTSKIAGNLDRHLVFPLLEFLQTRGIYPEEDIMKSKIELLKDTNMVDFAMDIYRQIHSTEDVPEEMTERRKVVIGNLRELQETAAPIVDFLLDENKVKDLRNDKAYNIKMLQDQYNISQDDIEVLFKFAKFQFECGNYSACADFLVQYRGLCTKLEKSFSALWGKFASEILLQHWNEALEDLNKLQEYIDSKSFSSALAQLQQRIWLIHWSLFVFFNHENGMNFLVDMLMQDRYVNAIQTGAPHMLRYLAAAVIINKKRRNVLKELIKLIKSESYIYSDPITEFIICLFVDYDFEGAQKKLKDCETVLANDYFLTACVDDFVENARLFIFETYCRIHETIDMRMLANKLNMDQESAEKWIANLIRNARLNAKIDSQQGTVVMGSQHPGVFEQIVEKTKNLTARTYNLANAVIGSGKINA